ncbi:hypothetical protein EGR_04815 [Echinococcus granulosus]|uniref:Uncharacterized protein n=1 Tax=Echinococcus granulosus TaxID=6210 RepID=W6UPQ1_ECHGR|nr:hypothetical protein EGR_04815 [Echinococcus granulosus]EUB60257.1 hypothetical protein EGR_04815 [Echinococcus granulosus]
MRPLSWKLKGCSCGFYSEVDANGRGDHSVASEDVGPSQSKWEWLPLQHSKTMHKDGSKLVNLTEDEVHSPIA